ncbi:hypothetical protein K488DRAFT_91813 [Vararia minispora EC-137]|uniref:Uncharacterized protein n=2 Tax=Vararia minispora EC-137 TaxID=1314806 RepID=A0ACB8Q4R7_9AGAM|nr:hypothetical protein K488DRAFT_92373 [Vararia minispora EC-137]KAI0026827.1 hypothetical protein K488DRAFT_91813 [Vararia minispora EC-137]
MTHAPPSRSECPAQLVCALALDVPTLCEAYLNTLHTHYLLAPTPSFITSSCIVSVLSTAAL